jgi:type VI protein secretion system component VasA
MTVTLRETDFKDSGDIHLFGLVLQEFLCQFVSINSFLELVFVQKPSGITLKWNSTRGKKCLI